MMSLNITVNVTRRVPTTAVLTNLYDFINATFQDSDLYYTDKEVEELKKNPNNIFLTERTSK